MSKKWSWKRYNKSTNKYSIRNNRTLSVRPPAKASSLTRKIINNKFDVLYATPHSKKYKRHFHVFHELYYSNINYNNINNIFINQLINNHIEVSIITNSGDIFQCLQNYNMCNSYELFYNDEVFHDLDLQNLSPEEYFQYSLLYEHLDTMIECDKLTKIILESTKEKYSLMNLLRGIELYESN